MTTLLQKLIMALVTVTLLAFAVAWDARMVIRVGASPAHAVHEPCGLPGSLPAGLGEISPQPDCGN
jgi:hypothetical protein